MGSTYQQSLNQYSDLFAQKREFKGNYFLTNSRTGEILNSKGEFRQGSETPKMVLDIDSALDRMNEFTEKGYDLKINRLYELV